MITVITSYYISCYTPNLFILPTTNSTPGPWRSQVSKCDIQHANWGPQTHDSSTVSHCSDSGVPWVSYIGYRSMIHDHLELSSTIVQAFFYVLYVQVDIHTGNLFPIDLGTSSVA